MPIERRSLTHKFCIEGHEGYLTAGLYDDGTVGELFISDVGKEGSTLRGVFSAWATTPAAAGRAAASEPSRRRSPGATTC
jgi:ribonucleoside-diphosphate reductase alpha chain